MSKTLQVAGKRRSKKTTDCYFYKAKRKGRKSYYKKKSRKNMKRKTRALAKSIKKSKKLRGGGDPPPAEAKAPGNNLKQVGVEEAKGDFAEPDRRRPGAEEMGGGPWLQRTSGAPPADHGP